MSPSHHRRPHLNPNPVTSVLNLSQAHTNLLSVGFCAFVVRSSLAKLYAASTSGDSRRGKDVGQSNRQPKPKSQKRKRTIAKVERVKRSWVWQHFNGESKPLMKDEDGVESLSKKRKKKEKQKEEKKSKVAKGSKGSDARNASKT
ncbi:hypothetical protein LguiB_014133 [Lonicera macranthoides]